MFRIAAWLTLAAGFAAGAALAQTDDAGLYLYRITSSRADGAPGALGNTVLADLYVANPDYLVERLTANSDLTVVESADRYVRVSSSDGDTLAGDPLSDHLAATFVVDYDQSSVADLVEILDAEYGSHPSIDVLLEFVDSAITSKSYRRSFDLASQVAGSREGDCTEHAVLLAALARASNKPARIVFGVMLIEHEDRLESFGHAWTEIHDGRNWRIADATRPGLQVPDAWIRYLPLMALRDEGPGYALQLAEFAMVRPARIDRVRSASPAISM